MKLTRFLSLLLMGVLLMTAAGCRKRPTDLTVLPGSRTGAPTEPPPGGVINAPPFGGDTNNPNGGMPLGPGHPGWNENAEQFAAYTVHFAFDSSTLAGAEKGKVAGVADYLKGNAAAAVKVEGHCDERGTEEYNRSLGERRALAVREELVRLGIDPNRVDTISFGEDKPAAMGHDEASWSQNRRGVFILLTPPSGAAPTSAVPDTTPSPVTPAPVTTTP